MVFNRWRRYGYACVNFGDPLSIKAYCRDRNLNFSMLERPERFQEVQKLSQELMQGIASVVPILPVSLVSTVFLEDMVTEMDILEIEARSNRLIKKLKEKGAPILESSRSTRVRAIADAVDIMLLRRMISSNGDRFKVIPEEKTLLAYYANAIGHWR